VLHNNLSNDDTVKVFTCMCRSFQ